MSYARERLLGTRVQLETPNGINYGRGIVSFTGRIAVENLYGQHLGTTVFLDRSYATRELSYTDRTLTIPPEDLPVDDKTIAQLSNQHDTDA